MENTLKMGAALRNLRRKEGLSQAQLAGQLGISSSYLNLIEHDHRTLTAQLLLKLAQQFKLDLNAFGSNDQKQLHTDLMEVFGDPIFDSSGLTNQEMKDIAGQYPSVARAIRALYHGYRSSRESADTLATRISEQADLPGAPHFRLPSEEVSDFIQEYSNYFHDLELAAEQLWQEGRLESDDLTRGLKHFAQETLGITVLIEKIEVAGAILRWYDETRRILHLSEMLPPRSRSFQLANQIGLIHHRALLERLVQDPMFTTDESRALGRMALSSYFAGAVLMPYREFIQCARNDRYDIELMCHRFRVSFEQLCHRLTTLRRPGVEGIPFHMIRIDIAGNISKHFSASGIRFARFSGICPRWNVCTAFQTPGTIRVQLSQMPDSSVYFCIARTIPKGRGGYHAQHALQAIGLGCRIEHARELVYSDGVDLEHPHAVVNIGVTCRLCDRLDCDQRTAPPLHHPLLIDEHVRGPSLYAAAHVPKAGETQPAPGRQSSILMRRG